MKIAVSITDKNLDAVLDPRFGRAAYFLIVDSDTLDFKAYNNPNAASAGSAGIQSAQFVLKKGARAVITGRCGPNAYQVLEAAGIPVYETTAKPVRDLLKAFQEKQRPIIPQPVKGLSK